MTYFRDSPGLREGRFLAYKHILGMTAKRARQNSGWSLKLQKAVARGTIPRNRILNEKTMVAVLSVLFLAGCAQQSNAPKVVVCDTEGVFDEYTKDKQAALKAEIETLKEEAAIRVKKIKELQTALAGMKKGSREYVALMATLAGDKSINADWLKTRNAEIAAKGREIVQTGYAKVYETAQVVAKEKGYVLLLAPVRLSIGQQSIIYASDVIDITSQVRAKLQENQNAAKLNQEIGEKK